MTPTFPNDWSLRTSRGGSEFTSASAGVNDVAMDFTPVWAIVGALIGATGTFLGVVITQRETLRRELELHLWQQRAEAYVDLVSWTAWVQHWYLVGAPDPRERPLTVTVARTAARIRAFGDEETGEEAFRLLEQIRPYVSSQDLVAKKPPPIEIKELADKLAGLARDRLTQGPGRRR